MPTGKAAERLPFVKKRLVNLSGLCYNVSNEGTDIIGDDRISGAGKGDNV